MVNEFDADHEFSDCEVRSLYNNIIDDADNINEANLEGKILQKPCIVLEESEVQDAFLSNDQNFNLENDIDDSVEFICQTRSYETFQPESSKDPELSNEKSNLSKNKKLLLGMKDKIEDQKSSIHSKEQDSIVNLRRKYKFKSNSFSLGRTVFRGMSNYYKNKFEANLKDWEKRFDREPMELTVSRFISEEFDLGQDLLQNSEFLDCMVTILHSQNYKKSDEYIVSRDFKKIRNLLYCYSSNAKKIFIRDKHYAIIFNNFFVKAKEQFLAGRSKDKYPEFKYELGVEMEDINKLALKTISEST